MKNVIKNAKNCLILKKYTMTLLAAVTIGTSSLSFSMNVGTQQPDNMQQMVEAIEKGDVGFVEKILTTQNFDINAVITDGFYKGYTVLHIACSDGRTEIASMLIKKVPKLMLLLNMVAGQLFIVPATLVEQKLP